MKRKLITNEVIGDKRLKVWENKLSIFATVFSITENIIIGKASFLFNDGDANIYRVKEYFNL